MSSNRSHREPTAKVRFKMYKVGKFWVTAALIASLGGNLVGPQLVAAETGTTDVINQRDASPDAATGESTPPASQAEAPAHLATQTALTVTARQQEILAGQQGHFGLKLSVSGIEPVAAPMRLVVKMPEAATLAAGQDLSLAGVAPQVNLQTRELTYQFDDVKTGLSLEKDLQVATTQGQLKDGTTLALSAQLFIGDQVVHQDQGQMTVRAKAAYAVSNQVVGVVKTDQQGQPVLDQAGQVQLDPTQITGTQGATLAMNVGIAAPKKALGQVYFAPGSQILVEYVLIKGLTFLDVIGDTPNPIAQGQNQAGNTVLTFALTAPSLEAQRQAAGNLTDQHLQLLVRVDKQVAIGTTLATQARMKASTIDGETVVTDPVQARFQVAASFKQQGDLSSGSQLYLYNYGPKDGQGGLGEWDEVPDPQVTPDALLRFKVVIGPAQYDFGQPDTPDSQAWDQTYVKVTDTGAARRIQKVEAVYDIDEHLDLRALRVSAPQAFIWGNYYPLTEQPLFNLYVKYQDQDQYEAVPILEGITDTANQAIDMTKLVDNSRGVDRLKFVWTKPVAGQAYGGIYFDMTPKGGYYGSVGNDLIVNIAGQDGQGWTETQYTKDGAKYVGVVETMPHSEYNKQHIIGTYVMLYDRQGNYVPMEQREPGADDPRKSFDVLMRTQTAEIVAPPEDAPRVLNQSLTLLNQHEGLTRPGANKLQVMVENSKAASAPFSDLKSYVVLPEGVHYLGNDSQVTAQLVGGKTLLTIDWRTDTLGPNGRNTLSLPIDVDATLNIQRLNFKLYSTVKEADLVVPSGSGTDQQGDVKVVVDPQDIPGLNLMGKAFMTEANVQVGNPMASILHGESQAQATDGTTGNVVEVVQGQAAWYVLALTKVTDKALQNVTLKATLPSTGDHSLLGDQTPRLTTTDKVKLSGPVRLPEQWQGKATVRYLTVDQPAGITQAQVTDFSLVTGFTISFNDPAGYLAGGEQRIMVPVLVDVTANVGDQAYISYQVTANGLTPVEGLKAGIVVKAKAAPPVADRQLVIQFKDVTGKVIREEVVNRGAVGSRYSVTPPAIDGYRYLGLAPGSAPLAGTFTAASQVITLQYRWVDHQGGGTVTPPPTDPDPDSEVKPDPDPEVKPDPNPEPDPEAKPDPNPEPDPEAKPDPNPVPEVKPDRDDRPEGTPDTDGNQPGTGTESLPKLPVEQVFPSSRPQGPTLSQQLTLPVQRQSQATLPQTGNQRAGWATALGIGLLAGLSAVWFSRRKGKAL